MKLITRRILFIACFILFLIMSPLIILYAFGFRYDSTQKKIMQTGIIYLTPNIQDNIKILINNKEEPSKISIKGIFKKDFVVYNLLPKTYNIKIVKENYHVWEKNLVVLPGLITHAQPLLLPSNPKINQIFSNANVSLWSLDDKSKKIFFVKNNGGKISLNIYDFSKKTLNTKPLANLIYQTKEISSVPQDSRINSAPDGKKFYFLFPADKTRIILLASTDNNMSLSGDIISENKIIDEHWDSSSRFFLYLNEKGEIVSYDTVSKTSKKIVENASGFSVKDDNIYYLNNENLFFYRASVNNPSDKQQLSYVPLSIGQKDQEAEKTKPININKKIKILISAKNTLAVITPEKDLFTIPENGIPINVGNNIEEAQLSQNGEDLVFNSSYEIFTSAVSSSQENLVTRLSQKISNVGWHTDYAHVWFLANQTLKNIELDSRPTPNIVDFVDMPNKVSDIIYTDSNYIYYDQKNDDGTLSLYQIEIQK